MTLGGPRVGDSLFDPLPFSLPATPPGLVRSQPQGLQQLENLGGLELLGGALQSPLPTLRARAAFLLHVLLLEHPRLCGEPPQKYTPL